MPQDQLEHKVLKEHLLQVMSVLRDLRDLKVVKDHHLQDQPVLQEREEVKVLHHKGQQEQLEHKDPKVVKDHLQ